jgi:gliding motility-associated-like protein
MFVISTLNKGETVSVRTRYEVAFDGLITEKAWGTGSLEDNALAAPLSSTANNAYINSIKISATEKNLVFGLSGRLEGNGTLLLFLDTKPGGFNLSNFGDVASSSLTVRGFNSFNNTLNRFDSYFSADYCIVISQNDSGVDYLSGVIELKTGNSIVSSPTPIMAQNTANLGIRDYDRGFELSVLRSQIGYMQGDIKFFGLTMQDDIVTNSFLSPELMDSINYGNGSVDYNLKSPNPVVVSADALSPCYKVATISVNLEKRPSAATVGPDQFNCSLMSGPLGGNTPIIGTGVWTLKSGPGLAFFSDASSGSSSSTVDNQGIYIFTWTISNGVCAPSPADINVEFRIPPSDPMSSNQTVCADTPVQKLTASATAVAGQTVKWYDSSVGGNVVSDPSISSVGTITYFAESQNNTSLCVNTSRTPSTLTINANPLAPTSAGDQSACVEMPIQRFTAAAEVTPGESIVWYDSASGGSVIEEPILDSIGTISYYAEALNNTTFCVSDSRTIVTLSLVATPIVPESAGDITECVQSPVQTLTASATSQSGTSIVWYDAAIGGNVIATPTVSSVDTFTYYAESSDGVCRSLTRTPVTLTIFDVVPNAIAMDQTVCSNGTSTQTITATAIGNTITWYSDPSGGSVVESPTRVGVGTVIYYAESSIGQCKSDARTAVSLTITAVPEIPTVVGSNIQPSCSRSTGEITIATQSGVDYSIGNGFQDSPVFTGLASGNYTISVRLKSNISCEVIGAVQTINLIPVAIKFETIGDCIGKEYLVSASPVANSYNPNNVDYRWKDSSGSPVGTNSNILNVSDLIASTFAQEFFPLNYTLTVVSAATGCETVKTIVVETIYCNIQKGVSPDGNGSNDNFDLRLLDVRKLEIFNRYGLKVYEQFNYTDQWKGQTDKGENLPSATYFYVIEFNKGVRKTGWVYLIREKQ